MFILIGIMIIFIVILLEKNKKLINKEKSEDNNVNFQKSINTNSGNEQPKFSREEDRESIKIKLEEIRNKRID